MVPGSVVDDRFVIERTAGSGGMGTVYRALDRESGRPVALKLMHLGKERDLRFAREAKTLAELRHPGIVDYVAHGRDREGRPYLAMEWLEGLTLGQVIGGEGLSVAEAVTVVTRAAEALGAAHALGIVHRDVKPSNVILVDGRPETVKVIDFGIAHRMQERVRLTRTGTSVGTPDYMAPEQVRQEQDIGPSADVFALGSVLYEALTGRPAWNGRHVVALHAKILLDEPPALTRLCEEAPPALATLIGEMLAKDRSRRPPDGAAVVRRLDALGPLGGTIRRSTSRYEAPTRPVEVAAPAHTTCLVIATPVLADEGDTVETISGEEAARRAAHLTSLLAPDGVAEVLADGSVVVSVTDGPAHDACVRAARCAIRLREALSDSEVVVTGGHGGAPDLGDALDRGAELATGAALRAVFAGVVEGAERPGIQIEPWMVGPLAELFDIAIQGQTPVLRGARS